MKKYRSSRRVLSMVKEVIYWFLHARKLEVMSENYGFKFGKIFGPKSPRQKQTSPSDRPHKLIF